MRAVRGRAAAAATGGETAAPAALPSASAFGPRPNSRRPGAWCRSKSSPFWLDAAATEGGAAGNAAAAAGAAASPGAVAASGALRGLGLRRPNEVARFLRAWRMRPDACKSFFGGSRKSRGR